MTRLRDDSRITGWPGDRMSTNHVSHCTTSSECFLGTWWRDLLWTFSDSLTDQWSLTVPWFGQSRDTLVLAERFAERCDRCDMFVEAWWSSIHLISLALDFDDDGDDDDNDGADNNDDDRQYVMSMMLYSPGWPRILSPNASPTLIHHPKPSHRHYFWNIFTCLDF